MYFICVPILRKDDFPSKILIDIRTRYSFGSEVTKFYLYFLGILKNDYPLDNVWEFSRIHH